MNHIFFKKNMEKNKKIFCQKKSKKMEETLIIIKNDAFERKLTGKIISRFEDKGYEVSLIKIFQPSKQLAEKHYSEHKGKDYFERITSSLSYGKVCVFILKGENVVKGSRKLIGSTDPSEALPGTIRGDFGKKIQENICHGSDSVESAKREIDLWF